jgi:acyl-CoA synthetase (AMP-forming)/AMP-acid ligase II
LDYASNGNGMPWLHAYPPGVDWAMALPPTTLPALFDAAVARFGSRPCLDFLGRRWSYAEVATLVGRAAAGLHRLGIGPGSRVGLCLPNGPHYVIAFFAVLRAGATVVNCNPLYTEEELTRIIGDAGVEVTVVGMPDAYRGESPAAFVELRPGSTATVEALRAMLAEALSPITMPKLIEVRPHLPRTAVGKLSKTELRAELKARQPVPDPYHAGAAP